MAYEEDTPPQVGTFRRFAWQTIAGLQHLRAFWGRRFVGGAIALMADAIAEAARCAVLARFPGHAEQAADSLAQVGVDRDLYRFRGETDANWLARIKSAWVDYPQGGTAIQVKRIVNQWGAAGWPSTWNAGLVTLTESAVPTVFEFEITIPFGLINPPWTPWTWGGGSSWGGAGLFWGVAQSNDIPMLLYIVKKWKPSRSLGKITVEVVSGTSVTFIV